MVLNSRQIEAFRMVMLRGSVTGAARALNVSQPAVSRLIRDLEARAGLTLFERHGNAVIPTPEANLLLNEVERYVVGLSALGDFTRELAERKHGAVRIVGMPAMAMGFLPQVLARYAAERPTLRIHLHGMPSHLAIEAVANGQADVAFAVAPDERPGLRIEPVNARLVVALPRGHRFAGRRHLTMADLAQERIIALAEPTIISNNSSQALGKLFRNATFTTPLTGIACQLVAAGAGVAVVDPFSVHAFARDQLTAALLRPEIRLRVAVVTSSSRPLSKLATEVIDSLKATIGEAVLLKSIARESANET